MKQTDITNYSVYIFAGVFVLGCMLQCIYTEMYNTEITSKSRGGVWVCRYEASGIMFVSLLYATLATAIFIGYNTLMNPMITTSDVKEFKLAMGI